MEEIDTSLTSIFMTKYEDEFPEIMIDMDPTIKNALDKGFDCVVEQVDAYAQFLNLHRDNVQILFRGLKTCTSAAMVEKQYDKKSIDDALRSAIVFGTMMGAEEKGNAVLLEAAILTILEDTVVDEALQLKAAKFGGEWYLAKCAKKRLKFIQSVQLVPKESINDATARIESVCMGCVIM